MLRRLFLVLVLFASAFLYGENNSVVCIHGLISSSDSFSSVKHILTPFSPRIYLWDYPSIKKNFCDHACTLVSILQRIAYNNPGAPIHFVVHSSGALVLRAALNLPDCPEEAKIGRAVLFAPPNQGSKLGRRFKDFYLLKVFIGDKCGQELMQLGPQDIACRFGCFPPTMEVLVIAGTRGNLLFHEPNDGFIALEETYLNTPYYLLTYPVTHGSLLRCKPALRQMANFLERGPCP